MPSQAAAAPRSPDLAHLPDPLADQLELLRQQIGAAAAAPPADQLELLRQQIGDVVTTPPAPISKAAQLLLPYTRQNPPLPNAILRAALFPSLPPDGHRPILKDSPLWCVDGLSVTFSGERFDQRDLDVLLGIFEIGRYEPLGCSFDFSAYALLRLLGRETGKANHDDLRLAVKRLILGHVEIRQKINGRKWFLGALLMTGKHDESLQYSVRVNADLAVMFGFGLWTSVDLAERKALGRNQVAKVFHLYYSSHVQPSTHSYETLAALAALQSSQSKHTRAVIRKAHEKLKQTKFLRDYTADLHGVTVVKARETPSQKRHAAKRKRASQPPLK